MPERKTYHGLTKRFRRIGKGGLKRFRTSTSRRFYGKTKKQRRQLHEASMVFSDDFRHIRQQLAKIK